MIHYSLVCDKSHKFDGWFSNAAAYDAQKHRGARDLPDLPDDRGGQGDHGARP